MQPWFFSFSCVPAGSHVRLCEITCPLIEAFPGAYKLQHHHYDSLLQLEPRFPRFVKRTCAQGAAQPERQSTRGSRS